jgi:FkbM family methyltransferase
MKIDKFIKEKFIFNNNSPFRFLYYFFNKFFSKFHYNKSFSQGSMDLIIQHIYKDKYDGVYIDVGCQHPVKNNNTYLLFKKGWSGINIDLDKVNIDLFNYYRPSDLNINVALSDKIEEVDLFYYHQKSPINTLDKKISDKQKAKVEKIIKVKTNTLTNILQSTQTKDIDVLSIDVEGYELKVLKGLNFNKYIPKIIIVEFLDIDATKWEIPFNNIDKVINSEIYSFLISKNYKFINWVNGDLVFINKDI